MTRKVAHAGRALRHVRALRSCRNATSSAAVPTTHGVVCSEGHYQSHIEDRKRREGPDADRPHRVAYEKLVRA